MKLKPIYFIKLRNDEHFQIHWEVLEVLMMSGLVKLKIEDLLAIYKALLEQEDAILKWIAKSALTDNIRKLDRTRDGYLRSIAEIVKAYSRSPSATAQEASRQLKILLDTYKGIADLPMREQNTAIHNIVQELNGKYKQYVERLYIPSWVENLNLTNVAIIALISERYEEKAEKPLTSMLEIRQKVDEAFRNIADLLQSFAFVDENREAFIDVIRRLNMIIQTYKTLMNARKNSKKTDTGTDTDIIDDNNL